MLDTFFNALGRLVLKLQNLKCESLSLYRSQDIATFIQNLRILHESRATHI